MYHTCGSASAFIPDLIEAGMDILNPVQVSAVGMDAKTLNNKYGGKISFHGAIDEQSVLSVATPETVSLEVKIMKQLLGANGGYIMCSSHLLQDDTPIESILAMYDLANRAY
jgi:uroporphyrinogen decarboxylase